MEDWTKSPEFNIKIIDFDDKDCKYNGIPGMIAVVLERGWTEEARWIGMYRDLEEGIKVVAKQLIQFRNMWEARRDILLEEERESRKNCIVEQADLLVESDGKVVM